MKKTFFGMMAVCAMMVFASCGSKNENKDAKDGAKAEAQAGESSEASTEGVGLVGTWVADASSMMGDDEEMKQMFQKCEAVMTIDGQTITTAFDMYGKVEEKGLSLTIGMKADGAAPYTADEETITVNYSETVPNIDLYEFKIDADEQTKAMMEAAGMGEESMKAMIQEQMKPENVKEMYDKMSNTSKYKMPDNNTLIIFEDNGEQIEFKRK